MSVRRPSSVVNETTLPAPPHQATDTRESDDAARFRERVARCVEVLQDVLQDPSLLLHLDTAAHPDGSLTIFIQKDEPTDPGQKANWLPAPNGPIYMVLRLYWPKEAILDGRWLPPGIQKTQ